MPDLLPALTARSADRTDAVVIDGAACSFDELDRRASVVAGRIEGATSVAVLATSTLETVVAVVAALAAGVPVVPIPPDAGPIELAHIVRDSGAELVLGTLTDGLFGLPSVSLDGKGSEAVRLAEPSADSVGMIMYTSGTTGLPKGAMLSRRAIAAALDGLADAWEWTADDHLVHGLPLFHVHGLILGVLGALRVGSRLTHTGRPSPGAYAAAGGTLYFGVPTVWSRVCGDPTAAASLRGARLLVSGSAPLPVSVFDRLRDLTGHAPVERYGMTETLITLSTRASGERRPGWVGTAIAGVETRLRSDEDGGDVARDGVTIGGLQVRGATMFDGYVTGGRPGDVTDDGWFVTGDAAVVDAGGFHRIVGRASVDIIKTGGYKVGAGEVESVFLDHPDVAEVAVVGVADDDLGQRIVAYVVLHDTSGTSASTAAVDSFVAERLTNHKRPREIRVVPSLPRNAMGKVLKAALADPAR